LSEARLTSQGRELQQRRDAVGFEERYAYLLHDRDSIFAQHFDESIERLGVKVLRSPPRSPKANAACERVIGTIRRECLDRGDSGVRTSPTAHVEILGPSLQRRTAAYVAGPQRSRCASDHGTPDAICATSSRSPTCVPIPSSEDSTASTHSRSGDRSSEPDPIFAIHSGREWMITAGTSASAFFCGATHRGSGRVIVQNQAPDRLSALVGAARIF